MLGRFLFSFALGGSAWCRVAADEAACSAGAVDCGADETGLLQIGPRAKKPCGPGAHCPNKHHKHKSVALLVIDMQNDFIDGTLTVPGGEDIIPNVNKLSRLLWGGLVFTMDYHPANHISFASTSPFDKKPFDDITLSYNENKQVCGEEYTKLYGASADASCKDGDDGVTSFEQTLWPDHCIQGTVGQQLHDKVGVPDSAAIAKKGITMVADSYGAFKNNVETAEGDSVDSGESKLLSENGLATWLEKIGIREVVVVGLALDYCVKFTSLQARDLGYKVSVVTDAVKPVAEATGKAALEELEEAGVHFLTTSEALQKFD